MLLPSLALLLALYSGTVATTVASWSRDPFAHGYLIVPLVVYLVWDRRPTLMLLNPEASFAALPLLVGSAALWFVGDLTGTRIAQQLGVTGMCFGLVWGILGWQVTRVLLFPLGLLLFALPLGDRLVPTLQDMAARISVKLLALSGVPVLLQGHVISIPRGEWKVAEACSGINYLTASLTIGYIYAGTAYRTWIRRIGFLSGSVIVPLVANGLRVYGTILVASMAGPQSIDGTRHFLFGWLVFALMMLLLFATCGRWSEAPAGPRSTATDILSGTKASPWRFATVALLVVSIAPISAKLYLQDPQRASRPQPPRALVPWVIADVNRIPWTPHFDNSTSEFLAAYQADGKFVKMYVVYNSHDRTGPRLSSVGRALFPDNWQTTSRGRRIATFDGRPISVRETELQRASSSLLIWQWYTVDTTFTDSDAWLQFYLAKDRLLRSPRVAAAMAVATESGPGLAAENVLQDFLLHMSLPSLPTLRASNVSSD